MTEWVLILMMFSTFGGATSEQVAGFSSETQCEAAKERIPRMLEEQGRFVALRVCIERATAPASG